MSIYPLHHEIENITWLVKLICIWAKLATYFKHITSDINLLPLFYLIVKRITTTLPEVPIYLLGTALPFLFLSTGTCTVL